MLSAFEHGVEMRVSHKTVAAVSTGVVLVLLFVLAGLSAEAYTALQSINPIALVAAVCVVIAGLAWFRKASKS